MDGTTVPRSSHALISVNQLAQTLKVLTVGGYGRRVSRAQSELYMDGIDNLYQQCLLWSDAFMPAARKEYAGLLSGEIEGEDVPSWRAESLAFSTTFMRILAGAYHDWMAQKDDWMPLARFLSGASLDVGGGSGSLLVDAGAMMPGDTSLPARRQEVENGIRFIVQQAKAATE